MLLFDIIPLINHIDVRETLVYYPHNLSQNVLELELTGAEYGVLIERHEKHYIVLRYTEHGMPLLNVFYGLNLGSAQVFEFSDLLLRPPLFKRQLVHELLFDQYVALVFGNDVESIDDI